MYPQALLTAVLHKQHVSTLQSYLGHGEKSNTVLIVSSYDKIESPLWECAVDQRSRAKAAEHILTKRDSPSPPRIHFAHGGAARERETSLSARRRREFTEAVCDVVHETADFAAPCEESVRCGSLLAPCQRSAREPRLVWRRESARPRDTNTESHHPRRMTGDA
ncbi:L-amino-acid oxidase, partial [Clarias magur]